MGGGDRGGRVQAGRRALAPEERGRAAVPALRAQVALARPGGVVQLQRDVGLRRVATVLAWLVLSTLRRKPVLGGVQ